MPPTLLIGHLHAAVARQGRIYQIGRHRAAGQEEYVAGGRHIQAALEAVSAGHLQIVGIFHRFQVLVGLAHLVPHFAGRDGRYLRRIPVEVTGDVQHQGIGLFLHDGEKDGVHVMILQKMSAFDEGLIIGRYQEHAGSIPLEMHEHGTRVALARREDFAHRAVHVYDARAEEHGLPQPVLGQMPQHLLPGPQGQEQQQGKAAAQQFSHLNGARFYNSLSTGRHPVRRPGYRSSPRP